MPGTERKARCVVAPDAEVAARKAQHCMVDHPWMATKKTKNAPKPLRRAHCQPGEAPLDFQTFRAVSSGYLIPPVIVESLQTTVLGSLPGWGWVGLGSAESFADQLGPPSTHHPEGRTPSCASARAPCGPPGNAQSVASFSATPYFDLTLRLRVIFHQSELAPMALL